MQNIKATASLSVSAQRRHFFTKKTFYIEKAKASFLLQELFLQGRRLYLFMKEEKQYVICR